MPNIEVLNKIFPPILGRGKSGKKSCSVSQALGEQLDATSRMTWQNRIILDYLLAEKGGVCVMFGDQCCTFIPNNTAPEGAFTEVQVQVQVELYCHSATCGDIQWNEMSCLTGPRCYINTDIKQRSKTL